MRFQLSWYEDLTKKRNYHGAVCLHDYGMLEHILGRQNTVWDGGPGVRNSWVSVGCCCFSIFSKHRHCWGLLRVYGFMLVYVQSRKEIAELVTGQNLVWFQVSAETTEGLGKKRPSLGDLGKALSYECLPHTCSISR